MAGSYKNFDSNRMSLTLLDTKKIRRGWKWDVSILSSGVHICPEKYRKYLKNPNTTLTPIYFLIDFTKFIWND